MGRKKPFAVMHCSHCIEGGISGRAAITETALSDFFSLAAAADGVRKSISPFPDGIRRILLPFPRGVTYSIFQSSPNAAHLPVNGAIARSRGSLLGGGKRNG